MKDADLIAAAYDQALESYHEGGLPIGSVLYHPGRAEIVACGRNLRVQTGDPTAHAEVVCLRNAGRRRDWPELTLVSTLSPCIMCTGTALLYRIPRILIGEHQNFIGAEDLFRDRAVELVVAHDARCIALMKTFVEEKPDLWNEDIGI